MGSNNIDKVSIWEKANLTIREAAEYSNIGINRIEELLKIPNCKFVLYVGKKKLVKRREFDKFLSDTVEIQWKYKILQFTFEPYYAILSMLGLPSIWY